MFLSPTPPNCSKLWKAERQQQIIYSSSVLRVKNYTISLPVSPFILIPVARLVLLFLWLHLLFYVSSFLP